MKKATLLIRRLEKIYTMRSGSTSIIEHGDLAIFHDELLYVGPSCPSNLLDKDTRVIDGSTHIAVPGFIECGTIAQKPRCADEARSLREYLYANARQGTLTYALPWQQHDLFYTIDILPSKNLYPLCDLPTLLQQHARWRKKRFCITAFDPRLQLTQLLTARMLKLSVGMEDMQLLRALTTYPAQQLQLTKAGRLQVGMRADVLLVHGADIQALFTSFSQYSITHIIKNGVCVYPKLII